MLEVKDLIIDDIKFNFNIQVNDKIAFYGKKPIVNLLLLSLSGIVKNMDTIKFNNQNIYDFQKYFNERIYVDCTKSYFQTIVAKDICSIIKTNFNKSINENELAKHIKLLCIRGECEITNKYTLSDVGNNLLNLAIVLSSDHHVLITNPFSSITKTEDFEYFKKIITQFQRTIILGTSVIKPISKIMDTIYFIGDKSYTQIDMKNDKYYIIDKHDQITPFIETEDKFLLVNPDKDTLKQLNNLKIKHKKISFEELDYYIGEEL